MKQSSIFKRTSLIAVLLLFVGLIQVKAQQRIVTGTITDRNGEPLLGASVLIKGSGHGATTNAEGKYNITVANGNVVLVYRYIGMEPYQTTVKDRRNINVLLHEASNQLDEVAVVSTGYQRLSRERSTGAFGFVDSTKLNNQMHKDLLSSLEGQVAGLRMDINPNTGEMEPILRGIGTFSSNVGTQPLIVINDMPTNMTLADINPYIVESITVLKDAAAASIYGALAANGVIVITTKQPKNKNARVTVNADWFITSKPNFTSLDLASSSDIIDYQTAVFNAGVAESGSAATFLGSFKSNYYNPLYQLYLNQEKGTVPADDVSSTVAKWRNNDYYEQYRDNAWRTAFTQRYNISISQKADRSNHYLSFNMENDKNRSVSDKSNSFALYYKSNYEINKWLKVSAGIDAKIANKNTPYNSYTNYDMQQRYEQILDTDGNRYISPYVNVSGYSGGAYNGSVVSQYEGVSPYKSFGFNVLNSLDESITKTHNVSLRPFVSLEARFLNMFKYNFLYQYEWSQNKTEQYDAADSYLMRMTSNSMISSTGANLPDGGRYYQSEQNTNRYTLRNQIDFNKVWRNHNINAIVGMEFRENRTPRLIQQLMYGYDPQTLTSDRMNWESLYEGIGTSVLSGNTITLGGLSTTQQEVRHRYASFYGNASYSYKYRYNLSGSIRWDEADLFGLDIKNQKHPLWSLGAGWVVTEEKFMKDLSWLDYLKLRMTYGVNGNVDQSSTTYFVVTEKTQSNPIKSTYLNYNDDDLPNPKLRWEKTATYNIGLDFRVLNNIINGTVEYYNRHSSDLLVRRYMDPTLGAASRVVNNGEMRNRGVEVSLTGNIVRNHDWDFSVGLTYSHNDNKMLKVDHSESDYATEFITSPQNYFMEGTSYNTLWAYHIDRIENGYPIAVDKDGNDLVTFNEDGTVKSITYSSSIKGTSDLVNMGTLTPKYNGSVTFNLKYKGFELNTLFIYSGGNKLRNCVTDMNDKLGTQTISAITNRWSATDANGNVRLYIDMPSSVKSYASTFQEWWQYGDINVKDADYIKLRSVSLAYYLPTDICTKIGIGSTKFTFQVNNLFTWCKAGNQIDPESYGLNTGTRGMSVPKTYSIGFSTSF